VEATTRPVNRISTLIVHYNKILDEAFIREWRNRWSDACMLVTMSARMV